MMSNLLENLKEEFKARRQKMLSEKIDVTAFLVWFIEHYPESIRRVQEGTVGRPEE